MEILATLAFVLFAILIFYIIQTLLAAQSTLKNLNLVLRETEENLKKLNSLTNTLKNISDITEKESEKLKIKYECKKSHEHENNLIESEELATWLISSGRLIVNFLKKR